MDFCRPSAVSSIHPTTALSRRSLGTTETICLAQRFDLVVPHQRSPVGRDGEHSSVDQRPLLRACRLPAATAHPNARHYSYTGVSSLIASVCSRLVQREL